MSVQRLAERLRINERLYECLEREHAKRPDRMGLDSEGRPRWHDLEIQALHAEVNRIRAERGLGPVSREDVEQIDTHASGHFDYGATLTLRLAELVIKQ